MTTEQFKAREAHIASAGIDEDWLARLGLALVPAYEVTDEGHARALMGELIRGRES